MPAPADTRASIRPFRIEIGEQQLAELRERLRRTRWAQQLDGADEWDYGVPVGYLRELVSYWIEGYDWRGWQARLNSYPQFLTTIDGTDLHFLHVRSPRPGAIPLLLSHGWPGSVADFLEIIELLTDPPATADSASPPVFDLVIPSLPGYGFSGPVSEPGWDAGRVAAAWAELMRRLGYSRYGIGGSDIGSLVAVEFARRNPEPLLGVHVTQIWSVPRGGAGELDGLSDGDREALEVRTWFQQNFGAYFDLHSQQPQTLAHALADSPAGLLAWYLQIYRDEVHRDLVLTDVSMAWFTETVASSLRFFYENRQADQHAEPTEVPMALAQFTDDFTSMHRFAERDHHNIVSWNCYDQPGHWAAHQSPELLAADIRGFFAGLA